MHETECACIDEAVSKVRPITPTAYACRNDAMRKENTTCECTCMASQYLVYFWSSILQAIGRTRLPASAGRTPTPITRSSASRLWGEE